MPSDGIAIDPPAEVKAATQTLVRFVAGSGSPVYVQEIFGDPERKHLMGFVFVAMGEDGREMIRLLHRAEELRSQERRTP